MGTVKEEKAKVISEFREKFKRAQAAFLADYQGIKSNEMNELRKMLRDAGVEFGILKNTLARLAVKDTPYGGLLEHFTGATALALSYRDPAAMAKTLSRFAKEQPNLRIRIGAMGERILKPNDIKTLSELPSRAELLAKFLGVLKNVPGGFVGVLGGVPRKFVQVIGAIKNAREGNQ